MTKSYGQWATTKGLRFFHLLDRYKLDTMSIHSALYGLWREKK